MDIGGWLRGLGLECYERAFRDNEIDLRVLPELTADDLKDLGAAAIGHRRKLLTAIAALREAPAMSAPVSETSIPPRPADSAAEWRLLTILFCDLVGSTEIATRLDPEDLREVIAVYQRCVAEVLKRFGGFVAKYMGDGILAYFGYPQAHEEDAEQAVRAALAIVAAVGRLDVRTPLAVRLGIATGLVVVGDLIGEGAAQEQSVVGETPNLAARLQGLAGADQIIVADATRQHVGTLFELRNFGKQELKGFAGVTQAWQVVGESGVASRFEALRSRATPLVGREEELELLLRRWAQAKAGDGRVVLLSAEPGIGKSRLTEAVQERIGVDPRLGRHDGTELVKQLAGNAAALSADMIDEIIERTDGVPLFLEEVTKVVLEAEGTRAAIPGARNPVPATLQASLLARLDRLGSAARETAQNCAAIGREFSYELVTAVATRGEAETHGALERLVATSLVFQRGTPPAAEYQFKHALVQDTAYGIDGRARAGHGA